MTVYFLHTELASIAISIKLKEWCKDSHDVSISETTYCVGWGVKLYSVT